MGRKHVNAIRAGSPELAPRPKTLGGPIEAPEKDALRADEISLLNQSEPSHGFFRTGVGLCAYSVAPSPLAPGASEDCLLILPRDEGFFFVIADGAGGHPAGDRASRIAVNEVATRLAQISSHANTPRIAILEGFEAANHRIMRETPGALTTLLVVELGLRRGVPVFRTYHAGDSAALVFSGRGRVRWNTVMHSPVGYAVESGLIDPDQALHHEDLNLVSSLVGGPDVRIELGSWVELRARETLLVATDGLLDNAYRREIGKAISSPKLEEANRKLAELARKRMLDPHAELSKPDDCSFVLFRGPSAASF